jgi:hypothetical protein
MNAVSTNNGIRPEVQAGFDCAATQIRLAIAVTTQAFEAAEHGSDAEKMAARAAERLGEALGCVTWRAWR